jgi:exosortase
MLGAGVWLLAAGLVYGPVLAKLARHWSTDATYSHGFVVPVLALFLVWQRRDQLQRTPAMPSASGLLILASSLGLFVAGSIGAELFVTRVSIIGVIAGTLVYAFGWQHLRLVAFPLAFLLFMIPVPSIVFGHAAVSLQLIASQLGENLLRAADVPVLRDGNLLKLSSVTLEVNEACSGIRSLGTLVMMTTLIGYLFQRRAWGRVVLPVAAIPLAIGLNGVRIAVTGMATLRFGPLAASEAVHTASGWVVFVAALACLWGMHLVMQSVDRHPVEHRLEAA